MKNGSTYFIQTFLQKTEWKEIGNSNYLTIICWCKPIIEIDFTHGNVTINFWA